MAMKYWVLKLQGQPSLDEIHTAIGKGAANVVRVHFEGGETDVYLAAEAAQGAHITRTLKGSGILKAVSAAKVIKLG
jgi:hypothetical protein